MSIAASGFEAADAQLAHLVNATTDLSPVFRDIIADTLKTNAANWGSGWSALTPEYAAAKAARYPGQPVEVRTGRLRDSLTKKFPVESVGPHDFTIGTDVPYARAQRRRLLPRTDPREAWVAKVQAYVAKAV